MRIAVCDDDAADRKRLCGLVAMYCSRHCMDVKVEGFASGAELLRRMKQTPFSIVFMDIFLDKEHGVELAHVIRKPFEDCILFFSTISKDFALESYELNALHYLVKPIAYSHVEKAMDRCGEKLLFLARTLLLSPKQQTRILMKDIIFVEVFNKNCLIHTARGVESTRKTIGELETELGTDSFLRCHRSYIVNLECIRDYEEADFVLSNGMRVPIRQAGRNRIKQAFRDYLTMRVAGVEKI